MNYLRLRNNFPLLLPCLLIGCGGEAGPQKYQVSGSVLVNNQPAELVRVQFLHKDETVPGNLRMPAGMTDASGKFRLSTDGDGDGAVVGDYKVVFEWMSANDLGAYDKFGGKFAQPKSTTFEVQVEAKSNQLPPFELTIPESAIVSKPPRGNPQIP